MKVLAVAHENDLSGANKSLLGIISNLSKLELFDDYFVNLHGLSLHVV